MLQSEFEERVGFRITPEEYREIESLYLACSMNKDEFCKEWLKTKDSKIVRDLTACNNNMAKALTANEKKFRELGESLADYASREIDITMKAEIRQKAIGLLGQKEYFKLILCKGYELVDQDKWDICDLINKL